MAFPKSVKDQMLVASARHCCVCHRYKGVKVEVHHIIQEANGGPNSFENAIALCFDCHADAGHYNPRHPRGAKFSPEELRRARREWLETVKLNKIEPQQFSDTFLCRYFICKSFEVISEIANLDLNRFPVPKPMLFKNHVFSALADIVRRHPSNDRNATHMGKQFNSEEEYLKLYPHPKDVDYDERRYPYFLQIRLPTHKELVELSKSDGIAEAMLEFNVPASEGIAVIGCYESGCEGIMFQEEYLLRNLWCVFLTLENITDSPVTMNQMSAIVSDQNGFENLSFNGSDENIALPRAPIEAGATVVVPVAVVLPPLHPLDFERIYTKTAEGTGERYLGISHCIMDPEPIDQFLTFGGFVLPKDIIYSKSGQQSNQMVHKFDLQNFYEIDMHWGCGSCPHLFLESSAFTYGRELLRQFENCIGSDSFIVPDDVKKIIIAELEDEVTEITSIKINGVEILTNIELKKGENLSIYLLAGDFVEVIGKYVPLFKAERSVPSGRIRNSLVYSFIMSHKRIN